jgi:dTDP-4-dehydrorhamnose 3,5-epimerase
VVSDTADFHYKVTSLYAPAAERSLRWDDRELGITWPVEIGITPLVSAKDAVAASFAECEKYD